MDIEKLIKKEEDKYFEKLKKTEDSEEKGNLIRIFGSLALDSDTKYKKEIREIALKSLEDKSDFVRERATWVVGWIGEDRDIKNLDRVLKKDKNEVIRGWGATQMMHIYFSYPESKEKILKFYKEALLKEESKIVLHAIIYSIQEICEIKLGLNSNIEPEDYSEEKILKLRDKAIKYLEKYYPNF